MGENQLKEAFSRGAIWQEDFGIAMAHFNLTVNCWKEATAPTP